MLPKHTPLQLFHNPRLFNNHLRLHNNTLNHNSRFRLHKIISNRINNHKCNKVNKDSIDLREGLILFLCHMLSSFLSYLLVNWCSYVYWVHLQILFLGGMILMRIVNFTRVLRVTLLRIVRH